MAQEEKDTQYDTDVAVPQYTGAAGEEFAAMVTKLQALISLKLENVESLQTIKTNCLQLNATTHSTPVHFFDDDQQKRIKSSQSVEDLFDLLRHYWSWCDFDMLKQFIKSTGVEEAVQMLETHDYMTNWQVDVKAGYKMIKNSKEDMSRVIVAFEESLDTLSKQDYKRMKSKLLDFCKLHPYAAYFNGEVFSGSIKLLWYIPTVAVPSTTKALREAKLDDLLSEGIIFVQVADKIVLDKTKRRHLSDSHFVKSLEYTQPDTSSMSLSKSYSLVDVEAKVVMLGALAVGKTSITLRYIGNLFSHDVNPTIAASFFSFTVHVGQSRVKFQLWDTAGHERFHSMLPMYYRRANAAIVVYDVTSQSSFEQVSEWITELKKNIPNEVSLTIVGNKIDLKDEVVVPTEKGGKLAASLNAAFVESSAAEDIGIRDIFARTAIQIVEMKQKKLQDNLVPSGRIEFTGFPQPSVVIGGPPNNEPGNNNNSAVAPPGKPKRKCCPW